MNNFLSQFESNNYKQEEVKNKKEIIEDKKEVITPSISEIKKEGIVGPEHEIEIDPDYKKRRNRKYIIGGIAFIILVVLAIIFIKESSKVTIIEFIGKDINEVDVWALKNDIIIDKTYVFNNEYSQDVVTSQDKFGFMYKKEVLTIEVSKGVDLDEKITIPGFEGMTYTQIREWIDENKLTNTYIVQEYNARVEKSYFIRMTFSDDSITASSFKRKDGLTIYTSKGSQSVEKNIMVIDFTNKTKAEVDTWASSNDITIKYIDTASNTINEGLIISQDIVAGEMVAQGQLITLKISIGKAVVVPDFININKEDALAMNIGLTITAKTRYSATISYGKLISQSVAKGTKLYKDNKKVELVYSLGKPFIGDIMGKMENELPVYFYEINVNGANLTFTTNYVDSAETRGTVVSVSKKNEYLNLDDNIVISISKGNL